LPLVSFLEQSRHDEWQVQLRCTLATATLTERWSELLAVAQHEAALFAGMSLQYVLAFTMTCPAKKTARLLGLIGQRACRL
jgi:hypothetical protein